MNKRLNEPAFPAPDRAEADFGENNRGLYSGMTLRDYFAAKAMQSFIHFASANDTDFDYEAKAAYKVADAMLKARSNHEPT